MSAQAAVTTGPASEPAAEGLAFEWLSSIADIGPETWAACFPGRDMLQSYALQQATEAAGLEGVEHHYLLVRSAGAVEAVVPCFRFRMSLTVIAPSAVRRVADAIRRWFPSFLYLEAFVVGTPVAICKDLLGVRARAHGRVPPELLRAICRELQTRARSLRIGLIMVKEITPGLLPELEQVLVEERFSIVESAATTFLYLGESGPGSYRQRLRKKYRSLMSNRLQKAARAGMRWELRADFASCAAEMRALYLQVLERSKIRFETLNPEFFAQVSERLGADSFALLGFQDERLVACELFVADDEWVHPIYLGIDYTFRDQGALYFNCIYKVIEVTEARGKPVVQLGQTSYAAKASIGAVVGRLYLALHHTRPWLNRLLRRLGPKLFPPAQVPRRQRVFRDMEEDHAALVRHGIHFEEAAHE